MIIMFSHKHRADEIPDFKGFLIFLQKNNPELHQRYTIQLKKAFVADVLVFIFFLLAVAMAVIALIGMVNLGYLNDEIMVEICIFVGSLILTIVTSVIGRKGHSEAIKIETEIVAEYHHSGFKEGP